MTALVFVGNFPPPVHGMAAINQAFYDAVQGVQPRPPIRINISPPSLSRNFSNRARKVLRVLEGLPRFVGAAWGKQATLYMSISGGSGQLYELLFTLLARLMACRLYLHHHSYAYLDRTSSLARLLCWAAGEQATHIVLSAGMADRLQDRYGVKKTLILSNTAFLDVHGAGSASPKQFLSHVGFLGNISEEKGIVHFLTLCRAIQAQQLPVKARIAGPFQEKQIEALVRQALATLPNVEYVGPVYGEVKSRFFSEIDVLAFPTVYFNEAEPLTIHEALSHAVPVIAYERGTIGEVLTTECGHAIPRDQDYTSHAIDQLKQWLADSLTFQQTSLAARERFVALRNEHQHRLGELIAEITHTDKDQAN